MITEALSEKQIKLLHETSCTILKRVGVIVPHKTITTPNRSACPPKASAQEDGVRECLNVRDGTGLC